MIPVESYGVNETEDVLERRKHRVRGFVGIVAIAVLVILGVLIGSTCVTRRAPVLNMVSIVPAGVFDDSGEMWLLTLSISNPDNRHWRGTEIHIKDVGSSIEARVTDRWIAVEGKLGCHLNSWQKRDIVLLLPAGSNLCRFSLQYTGSTPSFKRQPIKGRLEWVAEQLPWPIRKHLPLSFWRWVGYGPDYAPSADWREIRVEMPLPPSKPTKGSIG